MKKIFFFMLCSFCAILNVHAQSNTLSVDSLSSRRVSIKAKIDTQLSLEVKDSKQNLIIDTTEKNRVKWKVHKVIVQYVVSKISDSSFVKVEVDTKFSDDAEHWKMFLLKNLNANTPIKNKVIPGIYQVIIRFIESKDGNINDVIALTNYGYGMEEEVIRLVKKRSKWLPANQNGNIVRPLSK
jgi:hypothetical protein